MQSRHDNCLHNHTPSDRWHRASCCRHDHTRSTSSSCPFSPPFSGSHAYSSSTGAGTNTSASAFLLHIPFQPLVLPYMFRCVVWVIGAVLLMWACKSSCPCEVGVPISLQCTQCMQCNHQDQESSQVSQ